MRVSDFELSGEWCFWQETPQRVRMYRHRDGAVVKAEVDKWGVCTVCSVYAPFPLYVVNQLKIMLGLDDETPHC